MAQCTDCGEVIELALAQGESKPLWTAIPSARVADGYNDLRNGKLHGRWQFAFLGVNTVFALRRAPAIYGRPATVNEKTQREEENGLWQVQVKRTPKRQRVGDQDHRRYPQTICELCGPTFVQLADGETMKVGYECVCSTFTARH